MSQEDIQAGRDWVTETFKRLAEQSHVQIECVEWKVSDQDFDRDMHSLVFILGDTRRVEKFSRQDLTYCQGESGVRAKLESRIRGIVKSLSAPEQKLGF